ncbi:Zinc finger RING-type [Penicillium vulpinum]|uniref:Zinc finger RING-type n=1 Tax=Penicillium vulpinum TaxID=29845 RepID=UPI0025470E6C|nr:Zinc finger RING-type [Penicillium vulpinum]KAJ5963940.1 Zinc finger RING-type [Penicillium vulpinum]
MADNQAPTPESSSQGRGSRRRGRGGAASSGRGDSQHNAGDGERRPKPRTRGGGRGGGGGGGDAGRQNRNTDQTSNHDTQPSKAATPATKKPVEAAVDDADDGEVCFICASAVEHTSVSPCNHRTCHICALRLRALYKNKACAHCRTESNYVIFTDDPVRRYEEFDKKDFARTDENLGIEYGSDEIFEDTVLLLRYNCPDEDCDVACLGWPDLHRHVKSKHSKVMCDLCTRNKKVFTHEHELFTMAELRKHEKSGDDKPGAIDQSGFRGHPECGFCRQRFYGDDELYTHCRDKHERCHICDRRSSHRQQQYYIDYNALENHFHKDHFACLDKECLEKKFVVFESQMDLKAHQLEAHPEGLSKDVRRDARMVDLAEFDNMRTPYQQQRQRRGAGRGRDPNAEPLPVSSAQPMTRAEVAYQRQMAIQSSQSISTRNFGGQLTRDDVQPVRAPERSAAATPVRSAPAPRSQPLPTAAFEGLNISANSAPATAQDQTRRMRHEAVIERASNLLHNDPTKLAEFRSRVSSYRASSISANELIDAFFSLFDTSSTELGKLIKELAEIYEDESKRSGLLRAWNDWRAINEDYPALPAGGLLPGMSPGNTGGKRVLRLKSSTAKSSRSVVGRSGALPNAPSNPFPPLSAAAGPSRRGKTPATPWATAAPPPSFSRPAMPSPVSRPSSAAPSSSRTPATPAPSGADSFPALPAAAKPNVLMAGKTRGTVRWNDNRGPAPNAWGSNPSSGTASPAEPSNDDSSSGKKGKKNKGKQTLFHFG